MNTPLSNEEKLDEIYRMLKKEESRRKRGTLYKFFKYIMLFGIIILILTNPVFIVTQISNLFTPIILENVKTALESQKGDVMETFKNMIPGGKNE